ncbi:MAG: hypothetical protein ONB44_21910 [candidate division KSB1 bacterium]|nr:hypothetical protein [candidate division KSB1 bacterium]MDZ7304793.1 hypothetical protein [candidate division KSB1 bacterium]MDZ7313861.1 hypothetical protein [candidate division KSB1 bacterium]
MPVYKYRSFHEARAHLAKLQAPDPLEKLARLEAFIRTLQPRKKLERGIFRFKTLEEANLHRKNSLR